MQDRTPLHSAAKVLLESETYQTARKELTDELVKELLGTTSEEDSLQKCREIRALQSLEAKLADWAGRSE